MKTESTSELACSHVAAYERRLLAEFLQIMSSYESMGEQKNDPKFEVVKDIYVRMVRKRVSQLVRA